MSVRDSFRVGYILGLSNTGKTSQPAAAASSLSRAPSSSSSAVTISLLSPRRPAAAPAQVAVEAAAAAPGLPPRDATRANDVAELKRVPAPGPPRDATHATDVAEVKRVPAPRSGLGKSLKSVSKAGTAKRKRDDADDADDGRTGVSRRRQKVQQGAVATKASAAIYDTSINAGTLSKWSGLDDASTAALLNSILTGQAPFRECAERLRKVLHAMEIVSSIKGREDYTLTTNADIDFVPVDASAPIPTAAAPSSESYSLSKTACVAVLFVLCDGMWHVVHVARRQGTVVVVGAKGQEAAHAAVQWVTRSGWEDFKQIQLTWIPSVLTDGKSDAAQTFDALLAYWMAASTYARRAKRIADRFATTLVNIKLKVMDDTKPPERRLNVQGQVAKVLIAGRVRSFRDFVMRDFTPFVLQ